MMITKEEVIHVSRLAKLELSEEQVELYTSQLNTVLQYIEILMQVDTNRVEPTSHAIPMHNVFREDDVHASFTKDESLANAPEKREDFFVVPKVI